MNRAVAYSTNIAICVLAVAVGVFAAEVFLRWSGPEPKPFPISKEYSTEHFIRDPDLGYALVKGDRVTRAKGRSMSGDIIYDVSYTIDRNGMRPGGAGDKLALFFGDSFTFGEAVNDRDTLPYQFSLVSGMATANFGVQGYSAHQMLRLLETGRVTNTITQAPTLAIYTLISDHANRSAGRSRWEVNGPRYEIVDGKAQYIGHFQSNAPLPPLIDRFASRSRLYRQLIEPMLRTRANEGDKARLVAIIGRSKALLEALGARFLVVVWVTDELVAKEIAASLRSAACDVLNLTETLPELRSPSYTIPGDGHPTAEAYKLAAVAIKAHINSHSYGLRPVPGIGREFRPDLP